MNFTGGIMREMGAFSDYLLYYGEDGEAKVYKDGKYLLGGTQSDINLWWEELVNPSR